MLTLNFGRREKLGLRGDRDSISIPGEIVLFLGFLSYFIVFSFVPSPARSVEPPAIAQTSKSQMTEDRPKIYSSVTATDIESILDEFEFLYRQDKDASAESVFFLVDMGVNKGIIMLDKCSSGSCEIILFYSRFQSDEVEPETINNWNQNKRFCYAYVEGGQYPVLQAELLVAGGVTRETIVNYMGMYVLMLNMFAKDIGLNDE